MVDESKIPGTLDEVPRKERPLNTLDDVLDGMKWIIKEYDEGRTGETVLEREIADAFENMEIPEEKKEDVEKIVNDFSETCDDNNVADKVRKKAALAEFEKKDLPL